MRPAFHRSQAAAPTAARPSHRLWTVARFLALACGLLHCARALAAGDGPGPETNIWPGIHWQTREPADVGLDGQKLLALEERVGGMGCVVRHGYLAFHWGDFHRSVDVASAVKPVISTLLLVAVQEGRLAGVDSLVADVEPRLRGLNAGKDSGLTWRHLASQTSGYGLAEPPGAAYAYNDFALAFYYDTLALQVFATNGTAVLRRCLATPLQFEDPCSFDAFGPSDRAGRLAISVRDLARFGLLYLRGGRWQGTTLLRADLVRMAVNSPIPATLPRTSGVEADMLPGQRTLGGKRDQTAVGPGYYSFNWWLNRTNRWGQRLFVDAPPDTFVASGHGGKRALWVFPSLDLVVAWNDTTISDHDESPGNPDSRCNRAARLIADAARPGAPPAR